jgi:hypothetical protein
MSALPSANGALRSLLLISCVCASHIGSADRFVQATPRAIATPFPGQGDSGIDRGATIAADRLVDSVGVNIHLHYNQTLYYENFDLVKRRLVELKIRHVRDGLIDTEWPDYFERHNALGRAGVKGIFIVGPGVTDRVLQEFPARVSASFEGYDGPNEYDSSGKQDWAGAVRDTMRRVRAVQQRAAFPRFTVYGPSVTTAAAYATLGDLSPWFDRATMHNYLAGRNPGVAGWGDAGYGSIAWNLALARKVAGTKSIVTTETGYHTGPPGVDWIPEYVASIYLPRLLLEQFRMGIERTYIYELCDEGGDTYGLLTSEGLPKPAFAAVRHLLQLLSDPGPPITPRPLRYALTSGPDVRHMSFSKRDGTSYVAMWIERPVFDVATRRELPSPHQTATLRLDGPERAVRKHAWQRDGEINVEPISSTASQITVDLSDTLLMLELKR